MILRILTLLMLLLFSCTSSDEKEGEEKAPNYDEEDIREQNAKWANSAAEAKAEAERMNKENTHHNKGVVLATRPAMQVNMAKFKKIHSEAVKGDKDYQYSLAMCYKYGYGVKPDYDKALFWFKKSADQGNKQAERVYKFMLMRK